VPDILARPLTPTVLSGLVDRKPHLLPALAAQVLPPPCPAFNPGDDLGIDVSSLRTAEDCRDVLSSTLAAMARGGLSPTEGAIIARRVDARLCADRRAKRLHRRLANLTDPVRGRR
jgi:hypothetical protein